MWRIEDWLYLGGMEEELLYVSGTGLYAIRASSFLSSQHELESLRGENIEVEET